MGDLEPGTVLALRYEIIALIGRGGMATVYRARHRTLQREVALKILSPRIVNDGQSARFEREARNSARLDHPGCIRVLDHGAAVDGSRFLAMDLLGGPTLRQELDTRGRVPIKTAVWIAGELLRALTHAHGRGVLHRDVKPANVMFSERDGVHRLVLIDFGLSQLRDDAPLTAHGSCVGSPSYLSPERLMGPSYDARADLYSVGIVLYEMLAGRRPFVGDDPLEIARRQITEEPMSLLMLAPDVPAEMVQVVHRALEKDPAHRFATAADMLAALEAAPLCRPTVKTAPLGFPVLARATRRVPGHSEPSATLVAMARQQRSRLRRLWSWLRFGRWRWHRGAA